MNNWLPGPTHSWELIPYAGDNQFKRLRLRHLDRIRQVVDLVRRHDYVVLLGPVYSEKTRLLFDVNDRLADRGAGMVVQALYLAAAGQLRAQPQPAQGVTYAHKIEKHEAAIDWQQDAQTIVRRVRAFNPFPGATAVLAGETIKVWAAQWEPQPATGLTVGTSNSGTIVAVTPAGIAVAAMNSIVNLTQLQRPGGKRMAVGEFLRGFDVQPGMRCDVAASLPLI